MAKRPLNDIFFYGLFDSLAGGADQIYLPIPYKCRFVGLIAVIEGVITGATSTVTAKHNGVVMADATLAIPAAGSGVGVRYEAEFGSLDRTMYLLPSVDRGLELECDCASTGAQRLHVCAVVRV